jgi:integrase
MATNREHLTDALIRALPAPAKGNKIHYDDGEPKGFGVCVTRAGHKSYVINYRVRTTGRERRYTIGSCANWGCTAARTEAKRLKQEIDRGGDPLADLEDSRSAPTVADLIERFELEHLPRKKPSTAADYRHLIGKHIRPHLGRLKVAEVSFSHIDELHRKITRAGHPVRGNVVLRVLSKMFNLAVKWAYRSDNPCKGVEQNTEYKRERYLSADELQRLTGALATHPDQSAANVIRILLLTGARRGEVLGMRWADVDLDKAIWSKPASSTKTKVAHSVPLSAPVRELVSGIRTEAVGTHPRKPLGEYVFTGAGSRQHVTDIQRFWRQVCRAAGIQGLRIHDLRHSHASFLVSRGASLPLIASLLGHASIQTTQRYSHMFDSPQRAAVEEVGRIIAAAVGNGEPAELLPFRRAPRRR